MPIKRSHTAAVTTKQHLIVAGGKCGSNRLDTVEVMDIQTLVWSTVASLPHPYSLTSTVIYGDQLYMLGGWDKDCRSKSVLTCSLAKLLQSCSETSSDSVWHRITDVPVYHSTLHLYSCQWRASGSWWSRCRGQQHSSYLYQPLTRGISSATCQLFDMAVWLQSFQPMR